MTVRADERQLNVTVPVGLYVLAQQQAVEEDRSLAALVRQALRQYLGEVLVARDYPDGR